MKAKKIVPNIMVGLLIIIFGSIIYGGATTERFSEVNKRLNRVTPDSLNSILITPINPDWNMNLTLDTIKIIDKKIIRSITNELNNANEKFRGRGLGNTWEADLILNFKDHSMIRLKVVDTHKGICMFYTNTMGNPKYKCDGLKSILETLSNYKEPLGRKR